MITKERLLETIKNMPEEKFSSLDDLLEEIILLYKIENSLDAAAKGNVHTEEEMDKFQL